MFEQVEEVAAKAKRDEGGEPADAVGEVKAAGEDLARIRGGFNLGDLTVRTATAGLVLRRRGVLICSCASHIHTGR